MLNLFSKKLTHSAREYFEKVALKKKTKHATLNGRLLKARANSDSKRTFSESSFSFAGGSAPYNLPCRCQRLAGLKELLMSQ